MVIEVRSEGKLKVNKSSRALFLFVSAIVPFTIIVVGILLWMDRIDKAKM